MSDGKLTSKTMVPLGVAVASGIALITIMLQVNSKLNSTEGAFQEQIAVHRELISDVVSESKLARNELKHIGETLTDIREQLKGNGQTIASLAADMGQLKQRMIYIEREVSDLKDR